MTWPSKSSSQTKETPVNIRNSQCGLFGRLDLDGCCDVALQTDAELFCCGNGHISARLHCWAAKVTCVVVGRPSLDNSPSVRSCAQRVLLSDEHPS